MTPEKVAELERLNVDIRAFFAHLNEILTPMEVNHMEVTDPVIVREAMRQLRPLVATFSTTDALPRLDNVFDIWTQIYNHHFPPAIRHLVETRRAQRSFGSTSRQFDQPRPHQMAIYDPRIELARTSLGSTLSPQSHAHQPQYLPWSSMGSAENVASDVEARAGRVQQSNPSSRASSAQRVPPSPAQPTVDPPTDEDVFMAEEHAGESPLPPLQISEDQIQPVRGNHTVTGVHSPVTEGEFQPTSHQHAETSDKSGLHACTVVSTKPSHGRMAVSTPHCVRPN